MKIFNLLVSILFLGIFIPYTNAQINCDDFEFSVDLGENITIELGDEIELEVTVNAPFNFEPALILWQSPIFTFCSDCYTQDVIPHDTTIYGVSVEFTNGCITQAEVTVSVLFNKNVYVPNAFSPTDDGLNDYLYIFADNGVQEIELWQIYSRKGHLLFEVKNFEPNNRDYGWDGRFGGKLLDPEVYVWKAIIQYINEDVDFLTGDVLLMR